MIQGFRLGTRDMHGGKLRTPMRRLAKLAWNRDTARRTTATLPHGFNSIRDRAVHCISSRPFSLYDYLDGRRTYDILITCRLVLPPNGLTVRSIRLVTVKIKYKKHENIFHKGFFFSFSFSTVYTLFLYIP